MNILTRFKFFLWTFGRFKVPLIGYAKPKLIKLNDQEIVVRINLTSRTKNHLNSMYFGALSIGADIAGGLFGFYYAEKEKVNISLVFKSFTAQFLKRPQSDVYFVCSKGETVKQMIEESKRTKDRVNQNIEVEAFINYLDQPEKVAQFTLELSIKVV